MGKKLGGILVLIVAGALMLYSASRTMHLLSATLPAGQEVLAVIALAAFDLGLVAWLLVFLRAAEGGLQRGIALLMVIVDLAGVVVGFLGDTLLSAGQTGLLAKMAEGDKQTVIMLTALVIAINIAGTVFYHLCSPDNLKRMTEEAARDKIQSQALAAIAQQANILAEELAPVIAADWVRNMRADFSAALVAPEDVKQLPAAKTKQLASAEPTPIEKFKAAFTKQDAPAMVTMASDSPTQFTPEQLTAYAQMLQDLDLKPDDIVSAAAQPAAKKGRPKKS